MTQISAYLNHKQVVDASTMFQCKSDELGKITKLILTNETTHRLYPKCFEQKETVEVNESSIITRFLETHNANDVIRMMNEIDDKMKFTPKE